MIRPCTDWEGVDANGASARVVEDSVVALRHARVAADAQHLQHQT